MFAAFDLSTLTATEVLLMSRAFLPAAMIVGIGALLGRWDACRHQRTLMKLIDYIFLPCLAFYALHRHPLELGEIWQICSGVTLVILAGVLVGLLFAARRPGWRGSNLVAAAFMSSGTLLLPLAYALFGSEGLAKAFYFHLTVLFWYSTLGTLLGERRPTFRRFLATPALHATIIGLFAATSPIQVPENLQEFAWLTEKGIEITGLGALPLLLINFGYPLAHLRLKFSAAGLSGALLRVVGGPLFALAVIYCYRKLGWFSLTRGYELLPYIDERTSEAVLLLGAAMPSSHYALRLGAGGEVVADEVDAATLFMTLMGGVFSVILVILFIDLSIFD